MAHMVADIDECADEESNSCDLEHMVCHNKPATYECGCEDGYELADNGTCRGK